VALDKGAFIGAEAARREKESGGERRRVSMVIDAADADVLGDEPIWYQGKVVGWVTSGGFGHFVELSLAQGYIPSAIASDAAADGFEVEILGERRAARILAKPPFDPEGTRMRL